MVASIADVGLGLVEKTKTIMQDAQVSLLVTLLVCIKQTGIIFKMMISFNLITFLLTLLFSFVKYSI